MFHKERPLREQLIVARAKIVEQLDEIQSRIQNPMTGTDGPPDYGTVYAELRDELRDIDALLKSSAENGSPA